jgi:uroporphyrinogen III methyltransferase/synthase
LATLADEIERRRLRPPALVIVGEVARRVETPSWFARRRLIGRRVLLTRPQEGIDELRSMLMELGAETLSQPAIELGPPADFAPLDAALGRLEDFDWLVFSSAHGVRATLDRLCGAIGDLRLLGSARLAAIGPGTAAALAAYHLKADLVPATFRAESLVEALAPRVAGRRCLLLRASRGREVLAQGLTAAGAAVEQVVAYESRDVARPAPEIVTALAAGRVDWVTVTSSAIARSLVAIFGEHLRRSRLVSISPITSETLRGLGHEPAAEATTYNLSGLAAAIR